MKIATIGMQVRGGAGLSSLKLHEEFKKQGHNARFFVGKQSLNQDKVELIPTKPRYKKNWWKLGTVPLNEGVENIVSSGLAGKDTTYLENIYDWADVVLLRWVTGTLSDWQIANWSNKKKPLVWCLSDMAPLTGGCHYSRGCTKYESNCRNCNVVSPEMHYYPSLVLERRKRLWNNITIVSPSNWLAKVAKHGSVMSTKKIHVIKTGVELDIFAPTKKEEAKRHLGISSHKTTLFFGADSTGDERKGYDLLLKALETLRNKGLNDKNTQVLLAGNSEKRHSDIPFTTISLGNVSDRSKMALAYSAADISVLPYKEDNLPNVMLESIACGTPVVAFAIGGMPDIISTNINGELAIPFDTYDFANCILKLIDFPLNQSEIRSWAIRNLDINSQASAYIKLFNNLIEARNFVNQ